MSFKGISYLELWQSFFSAEHDHLCNLSKGYYEEKFCEIIVNLSRWLRRRCCLKCFLSEALVALLCSGAKLCNFERGHHGKHSSDLDQDEMSLKDISHLELW